MPELARGDAFPELTFATVDGAVELRERWQAAPLVVAFMRHFGSAFCREHLMELTRAWDDIRAAGGDAVAIFQYRADPTRNFCRRRKVPFDCLGDPLRDAYAAVGLGRGPPTEYVGLKSALGWLRAARRGIFLGIPRGDLAQRPGTFVVDPSGRVVLAHYNADSSDNAPIQRVLEAVRDAAA